MMNCFIENDDFNANVLAFKMMDFALKMMILMQTFKMIDFALKMMVLMQTSRLATRAFPVAYPRWLPVLAKR